MNNCKPIVAESDAFVELSTYNVTADTTVQVGCKSFGHRVIGPKTLTCNGSLGEWSDTTTPKCAWTGELNEYEQIVIGVSSAVFCLLIIGLIIIIVMVTRRKKSVKGDQPYDYEHNPPYDGISDVQQLYNNPSRQLDYRSSGPYKHRISYEPYSRHSVHAGSRGQGQDPAYRNQNGYSNGHQHNYTNRAYTDDQNRQSNGNGYIPKEPNLMWDSHQPLQIPRPKLVPEKHEPY